MTIGQWVKRAWKYRQSVRHRKNLAARSNANFPHMLADKWSLSGRRKPAIDTFLAIGHRRNHVTSQLEGATSDRGKCHGQRSSPGEPRTSRRPMSVFAVTRALKEVIEGAFDTMSVEGEVFSARKASLWPSTTLKDSRAQLPCVMWRSSVACWNHWSTE